MSSKNITYILCLYALLILADLNRDLNLAMPVLYKQQDCGIKEQTLPVVPPGGYLWAVSVEMCVKAIVYVSVQL